MANSQHAPAYGKPHQTEKKTQLISTDLPVFLSADNATTMLHSCTFPHTLKPISPLSTFVKILPNPLPPCADMLYG